jgi:hypothetical protein
LRHLQRARQLRRRRHGQPVRARRLTHIASVGDAL